MRWYITTVMLLVVLLLVGCSQSFLAKGSKYLHNDRYDQAIDAFYKELQINPGNADAWRELGVAFYKKGNLTKAEDALKQSNSINPNNRTHLFLGLVYERQEMWNMALRAYGASLRLDPKGKTAGITRAHLDRLMTKKIESEVALALENESAIDVDTIPTNTIAVSNFDGSQLPADQAPLAIGLTEFIASDLSKVGALTVIERQKLDVIMDELKISSSALVDQSTAPRLGRLLGSNKLITGSVLGLGEDALRIDGAVTQTTDGLIQRTQPAEGGLRNIFNMQKAFVFNLIDSLGITLTKEERDAIKEVPTESYLAFLAYCRGLDYQNRGMYQAAQQEFNSAVQQDAGFEEAGMQAEATSFMSEGQLNYDESLQEIEAMASSDGSDITMDGQGAADALTTILDNSGILGMDITIEDPITPTTGTVIVKGNLDAQ